MNEIKIANKKYMLEPTFGRFERAIKRLEESSEDWIFHALLEFMKPNIFGKKPFKNIEQMKEVITLPELREADNIIADMIKVERPGEGN